MRGNKRAYEQKPTGTLVTKRSDQLLSPTDRLTYVYQIDITTNTTRAVVNVSYEIHIAGNWLTIIRFDSAHGYLHKHSRISLNDRKETTTRGEVLKTGDPKRWLTWAIQDIQKNFITYRRIFFKRSKITDTFY